MKKMSSSLLSRLAAAGFLCLVVGLARAQSDVPPEADPPDRAARLSFVEGEVSLQPAGEEDWASAVLNRPLTTGDKLWTDKDARAEIQVGPAAVRLGSDTGFSFLNVDDDTIQMRVTAGIVNVRVRALDSNDHIEIDTPNLALSLLRPGNYRVEVNDAGDTTVVKVSEGEAEASGGSQDVVVHAQQSAVFRGTDQLAPPELASLGAPDGFDSWTLERDRLAQRAESSQTARYVAPEVTGYEDLDANGSWSSDPEYGYVWTPTTVAVGWAPYRYGRWVWISPWGWTWVDDAPWGFAPFHYGRWAYIRSRWCWVPGPRAVRPVYAPALVGWVGTPGVSVTIAVGGGAGVAWFPLGPREVYVPARRFSPRYVERVNVTNTVIVNRTYITNVYENRVTHITYRNRTVPGAVTAVSRTTFTSAQPVGRHTVRLTEREITRVQATAFAPRIEPVRESRLGTVRRNVRVPPATIVNRQVIVKREPPPAAARFARNAGERDAAREQADRLHRIQDRNEAVNRTRPNRNAVADERPRESTPRRDRPPATPDHIDRAGSDADRLQQERQARQDQRQREQDAQRRAQDLQQRQAQIQRDQEARQQQFQADRHVREERNDRDRADDEASQRTQLEARRQELQRQQESQRQDAQRQEMQRQLEARRQQDAQRQEMQRQQQAQREEMQRQLEARRQQDAQRQEMQRQQAARVAQREHANQPSRQQSPPPDRDRRRPDQSSREQ
ncbi:MAG TPA: DUF6600 domain-containing protein [Steroidobacteraceae bacterium]|nr:DUF6600 domain-containing protein [Steroidobacteraceae bacterium]